MMANEAARLLDMVLLQPELADQPIQVQGCYIGDLLSNVMGKAESGQLWLTVINNVNIVAVAQMLDLAGIVLLEDNQPAAGVLERANTEKIPVFSTSQSAYKFALRFRDAKLG